MKHKYSEEKLRQTIANSKCWAEVCRTLGITPATGSQTHLTKRAKALGIDYHHFVGRHWNTGRKFPEQRKPVETYLVKGSTINSATLRKRLVEEGLKKEACEICGLTKWRGKPIPLELDHKNSDHWDNRIENLSSLCPNCHAQATLERRGSPTAGGV